MKTVHRPPDQCCHCYCQLQCLRVGEQSCLQPKPKIPSLQEHHPIHQLAAAVAVVAAGGTHAGYSYGGCSDDAAAGYDDDAAAAADAAADAGYDGGVAADGDDGVRS